MAQSGAALRIRPARPHAVAAPGSDVASPPVFGAAVTTGSPPQPRAMDAQPRPLSPESRRKRQASKRLWRLQRTLVEADRRKFLKGYNPEKYEEAMAKLTQRRDMKSWFDFLDADGSGEIDTGELQDPLTSLGLAFSRADVEELIASVDADGTGEIGFEEFFEVVCRPSTNGKTNPLQALYQELATGALGDRNLHLSVLIAAFRRHLILSGLATYGPGGRKYATCVARLKTVNALETIVDEGEEGSVAGGSAGSPGSSARPPSTAISLTASAHSSVGDDYDYYDDAYDGDHRHRPPRLSTSLPALDQRSRGSRRSPSAAGEGPSLTQATVGTQGVSYRTPPPVGDIAAMQYTDEELAVFEANLLHRHLPSQEAAQASLADPGKRQWPDLRDYDAFKARGSNKSARAIVYSGLPRFSYTSVAAKIAKDNAAADARAQDMAGRMSGKSGPQKGRRSGRRGGASGGSTARSAASAERRRARGRGRSVARNARASARTALHTGAVPLGDGYSTARTATSRTSGRGAAGVSGNGTPGRSPHGGSEGGAERRRRRDPVSEEPSWLRLATDSEEGVAPTGAGGGQEHVAPTSATGAAASVPQRLSFRSPQRQGSASSGGIVARSGKLPSARSVQPSPGRSAGPARPLSPITMQRSASAPVHRDLASVPSCRSINVSTYKPGDVAPHATQVTVPTPDPAQLPPPPLKAKLRSADPRLMKPSESANQLKHMKYIGLTPQYSSRVARAKKQTPLHVRAGLGQGFGLWGYNTKRVKPDDRKSVIHTPKVRPELAKHQRVVVARARRINPPRRWGGNVALGGDGTHAQAQRRASARSSGGAPTDVATLPTPLRNPLSSPPRGAYGGTR